MSEDRDRKSLTVTALYRYPLKSAAGIALDTAPLDERGIVGDRRWMLVDGTGTFLSQRTIPRMALLRAQLSDTGLIVDTLGMPSLVVETPDVSASRQQVSIWADTVPALDAGERAAVWMQTFLGCECRLVYFAPDAVRLVDQGYAFDGEQVGFADGFPLLVIGQASLDDLNTRLLAVDHPPVSMDRFRPSIVIAGAAPFAEDDWQDLAIGTGETAIHLSLVKPCARCAIVPVDQATGVRGKEPLKTLATYRQRNGKVYFGQNAVHRTLGVLRVGDSVTVNASR